MVSGGRSSASGEHNAQLIVSCPQLLELEVGAAQAVVPLLGTGTSTTPTAGLPAGGAGLLAACTGLTTLKLANCTIQKDSAAAVSALVCLKDLSLMDLRKTEGISEGSWHARLPGVVLLSLPQLTRLELCDLAVVDVHHISALVFLHELQLCSLHGRQVVDRVELAPSISPANSGPFAFPSSLQALVLGSGLSLDTRVLLPIATQLTHLVLTYTWIHPHHRVGVQAGGMSSGGLLLHALAGLPRLQALELMHVAADWPSCPPCVDYTALTASSALTVLVLWDSHMPDAGRRHAFAPPRILPDLAKLDVRVCYEPWHAANVSLLPGCAPALEELSLTVWGGAPVAALKPLTTVTCLSLHVYTSYTDYVLSIKSIAEFTGLRSLLLQVWPCGWDSMHMCEGGVQSTLLPLTALRQLVWFDFEMEDDEFNATNKVRSVVTVLPTVSVCCVLAWRVCVPPATACQ